MLDQSGKITELGTIPPVMDSGVAQKLDLMFLAVG
jgi:hypothetical protein